MDTVNSQDFETKVINASQPVLVDFSASWCGPCKAIAPILESLSQEITDILFYKLDIDDAQDLAVEYGVTGVPTLIIFKEGKPFAHHVGMVPKTELKKALKSILI